MGCLTPFVRHLRPIGFDHEGVGKERARDRFAEREIGSVGTRQHRPGGQPPSEEKTRQRPSLGLAS
jgi:hypothetical protein